MAEYIERDALLKEIDDIDPYDYNDEFEVWLDCHMEIKNAPTADVVEIPESGIGDLSDGYHTFNELYHHRAILFSVICNLFPDKAWKSKLHDTGDMYEGMFIVGIETPKGQATYHYDVDPYWDMFKVKELDKAPKWDGHTPEEAIERISTLSAADVVEVRRGRWLPQRLLGADVVDCSECKTLGSPQWKWCPACGADMRGEMNDNREEN